MGQTSQDGTPTRVLIVDDHTTFTELFMGALDREPDLDCVGSARSVESAIERFGALRPDVVIMDYHLVGGNGLQAAARILAAAPGTRVILLTGDPRADALEEAARIGVCAFLAKDGSLATVLDAVRHAHPGNMVVSTSLVTQLSGRAGAGARDPRAESLTSRELAVLTLMAEGTDVRTNARILGITESTCRGHVKSILAKLGAHSQLEAVVVATRLGILAGS